MEKAAAVAAHQNDATPSLGVEHIVFISHLYEPQGKIDEITDRFPGISIEFCHVDLNAVVGWAESHRGEIRHHHSTTLVRLFSTPAAINAREMYRFEPGVPLTNARVLHDPADWADLLIDTSSSCSDVFQRATILITSRVFPASVQDAPNLKHIHLTSAGIDRHADNPFVQPGSGVPVTITTSSGASSVAIAEWVLMTTLTASRDYDRLRQKYKDHNWDRSDLVPPSNPNWAGRTVGIAGYGSIGRQVARIFSALGTTVHAYTARPRPTPGSRRDDGYIVPGTGDPDGSIPKAWFSGTDKPSLHSFLSSGLDLLVICLPLTSETRQLLSTPEFSLLQQTSGRCFIVNVARGAIIDQAALIHALQQGHVSGAALDVTDPEPLPADDPLWNAPNCFITPHVSWLGAGYLDRCVDILLENLQRRAAGLEMLNVVKKG